MVHTNELEKQETAGATYADCFRGVNLRRTEIAVAVWMIQNLVGNSLVGYGATLWVSMNDHYIPCLMLMNLRSQFTASWIGCRQELLRELGLAKYLYHRCSHIVVP